MTDTLTTHSTPKKGRRPPWQPRFLEVFRQTQELAAEWNALAPRAGAVEAAY